MGINLVMNTVEWINEMMRERDLGSKKVLSRSRRETFLRVLVFVSVCVKFLCVCVLFFPVA